MFTSLKNENSHFRRPKEWFNITITIVKIDFFLPLIYNSIEVDLIKYL